jgi:AcrR family transcriptional regulator
MRPTDSSPASSRHDDPLDLDATRTKILRGASEIFNSSFARYPTVDDIAQAAGVARRTFYRYFASTDAVLEALYDIVCTKVLERVRAAVASQDDAWGKLRAGLLSFLDFHMETGQLLRVLQSEALRPGSKLEKRRAVQFEALQAILDQEIQAAQGRRVDPMVLKGLLLAMEGLSNAFLAEAVDGKIDRPRAERVMLRIMGATLALEGGPLPPMPLAPKPPSAPMP